MNNKPNSPLSTLQILRLNRQAFHDKLCKASVAQNPLHLQKLRSENAFILAEFLFLLQTFELVDFPERFAVYIENHNAQLLDLIADSEKRRIMGLEVPRLKKGIFSAAQTEKAVANLRLEQAGLDQADMQRLTIMLFSPETGRRMIEILELSGFLERNKTPFQSLIIKSNGFVETCFESYLININQQILGKVTL